MVETSNAHGRAAPQFAVHLTHPELGKQRTRTLCERSIGLGDDAVIPYDVVTESQIETVDCPTCLERAGSRPRRWRTPRRSSLA